MSEQLLQLSDSDLRELAGVLRSGRLTAPFSTLALQRILSSHVSPALINDLQRLTDTGLNTEQIAAALDLILQDRRRRPQMDESVTLVTSGPEAGSATNRDTAVVVRDLFATAERTVLVAGYAVYQGNRVFQALADRMQNRPDLKVRLFLNIRRDGDTSSSNELVRRFADQFRRHQWPADRPLPEVFYFPQSIDPSAEKLATLHAKCVVVDRQTVFVSSANFTEAAQERNIEIGLLIRSTRLAEQIEGHFDSLQAAGVLSPVFE